MVLLAFADAQEVHQIPDLLHRLNVPDGLWDSFVATAGGPGNDLRLIAAMPHWTIPQIVGSATLASGDRLTPHPSGSGGVSMAQCKMGDTPTWRW